jgi:hypothetical protein
VRVRTRGTTVQHMQFHVSCCCFTIPTVEHEQGGATAMCAVTKQSKGVMDVTCIVSSLLHARVKVPVDTGARTQSEVRGMVGWCGQGG